MKRKLVWWVLIIAWCALIFYGSSNSGDTSGNQSASFLKVLADLFGGNFPLSEYFIRKCAHFSEYFILGCLLFKGFYKDKLLNAMAFSTLAGIAYAASDEMHQYFIPGRAPRVFDVFIDSSGLISGILLLLFFAYMKRTKAGNS